MQAAVVSVLLMVGACGNSGEPLPLPTAAMVTVSQPDKTPACSGAQCPSLAGGVFSCVGLLGCPHYSPVWLLKDCAAFYPGNYAVPYDYREAFNYPWHGPRPLAPAAAIEMQAAAMPAAEQTVRATDSPRVSSRATLTAK